MMARHTHIVSLGLFHKTFHSSLLQETFCFLMYDVLLSIYKINLIKKYIMRCKSVFPIDHSSFNARETDSTILIIFYSFFFVTNINVIIRENNEFLYTPHLKYEIFNEIKRIFKKKGRNCGFSSVDINPIEPMLIILIYQI